MSLLPHGKLAVPGLEVSALCVPAREVGGDYFDFLPIDDDRLGDSHRRRVGQGHVGGALHGGAEGRHPLAQPNVPLAAPTPAHRQPRDCGPPRQPQLHHDDLLRARPRRPGRWSTRAPGTLRSSTSGATRDGGPVEILAPDGLVLGLRIDRGEMFEKMLVEETLPLERGDAARAVHRRDQRGDEPRVRHVRRGSAWRSWSASTATCPSRNCGNGSCGRSRRSVPGRRSTTT